MTTDTTGARRDGRVHPASLRLQILGPLRIWRDGVEQGAGPRQQAGLLALLLAREGKPTSTAELIRLIWDTDPPASAVNVLHKYVGALRRIMEPTLAARSSGSYILRRGDGYLFRADSKTLDLISYRGLIKSAESSLAQERQEIALTHFADALRLWNAPAGDGLALGAAAMSVLAGLNAEFFDTCSAAAELAISLGRAGSVLPALRLAATMAPFHEPVQASLISTLAAAGRHAEASTTFHAVRGRLADELGIDPGHTLQAAHRRVLEHWSGSSPNLTAHTAVQRETRRRQTPPPGSRLVGRVRELTVLRRGFEPAFAGGTGLVLIEGEPGAGKTRLLEEVATEIGRRDATVIWGHCLEGDGTPSMWPWVGIAGALLDRVADGQREEWLSGELGRLLEPPRDELAGPVVTDSNAQFRLFSRVVSAVGHVAELQPLLLVVDDLHWADHASLQLFAHLAARLPTGTALIGAFRDRAPVPGTELARMLAAASRVPSHRRIRLGPLSPAEVAELVRRETGRDPDAEAARNIYARTGGNPFFVRELSRLLADGRMVGDDASLQGGVPATLRDVVHSRVADLDEDAKDLLQIAALIGRDVDLGLLTRVGGLPVQTCLDRLEPLEALGLLAPTPTDPSAFRFAHDIVRESVAGVTPQRRTARLHLRIADELQQADPHGESVPERVAYHLWSAGPLAEPARTAASLIRAGRRAAAKSALEAAERQLQSAAEVARTAGLAELELSALTQLTVVGGMRSMYVVSDEMLGRAEHLARGLGRELEATGFLFSRWVAMARGMVHDLGEPLARRLFEQGNASDDPVVRMYGLQAWGIQQRNAGEIGLAVRYLSQCRAIILAGLAGRRDGLGDGTEDPVLRDLVLLMVGMLAETTAVHGDVDSARALLDTMETSAGDDPYLITAWASFATRMATLAGDTAFTLRAADQGIAADPNFSFTYLGTYIRLGRCWALAMTGHDPNEAAAQAKQIIDGNLIDPPIAGVGTSYALLAEMHLAAGELGEAAAALDRADYYLEAGGQRYPEGLMLLLRAMLMRARGEPVADVRVAAEQARSVSTRHEAFLFARRADDFLAGLD